MVTLLLEPEPSGSRSRALSMASFFRSEVDRSIATDFKNKILEEGRESRSASPSDVEIFPCSPAKLVRRPVDQP